MSRAYVFLTSLLLAVLLPSGIAFLWLAVQGGWDALLSLLPEQVLPSVISESRHWFLSTLWLSCGASALSLLCLSWRDREFRYLLGSFGVLLMCAVITRYSMPFGEMEARRWQVEADVQSFEWRNYRADRASRLYGMVSESNQNLLSAYDRYMRFRLTQEDRPTFDYLPEDVAAVRDELQLPFAVPLERRRYMHIQEQLLDAVTWWMPDQADLWHELAMTGLFTADRLVDKRTVSWFINELIWTPESRDAWTGLAISTLFSSDCSLSKCSYPMEAIGEALMALQISLLTEDPSAPDPRLQQWLDQAPEDQRQMFEVLQARATVNVFRLGQQEVDPAVLALAEQPLPVKWAEDISRPSHGYSYGQYPGKVEVDRKKYGIINDEVFHGYPPIEQLVKEAVVLIALDIDPGGKVAFAMLEQSSGHEIFDKDAMSFARKWIFAPTGAPRRLSVPIHYVSDLRSWSEYYRDMEYWVKVRARTVARREKALTDIDRDLMQQFYKRWFPDRSRFSSNRQNTLYRTNSNYEFSRVLEQFKRSVPEPSSDKLTNDEQFVAYLRKDLANKEGQVEPFFYTGIVELQLHRRMEEAGRTPQSRRDVFLQAREHFLQALLNDPDNGLGWYGWGYTWLDDDPELAAGALALGLHGLSRESFASLRTSIIEGMVQGVDQGAYDEKISILLNRVSPEKFAEGFAEPLPLPHRAPVTPAPMVKEPEEEKGRSLVDFASAGVLPEHRVVPFYPEVDDIPPEPLTPELSVDIDSDGRPYAVMFIQSDGNIIFDQAAVDAAWQWRFEPGPVRVKRIPVTFEKIAAPQ